MKKSTFPFLILLFLSISILINCSKSNSEDSAIVPVSSSITLFDDIIFYSGYANPVNEPVPSDVIRVSNTKYAMKITDNQLDSIGDNLVMKVILKAACDNYDRIGSVFLNFIPKDNAYETNNIDSKIEIARFITPFMDKNRQPDEVSYRFEVNNIAKLLTDENLSSEYDFWVEFDIFGTSGAARKQIAGCADRIDTFWGTLKLISNIESSTPGKQYFVPIVCKTGLNNYEHTDVIGVTSKKFTIDLPSEIANGKLYLITSNHGANQGGEEYNRRNHFIYFDDTLIDTYKPGGESCEPFRAINTHGKGIYGSSPRTAEMWASFSNWCPGDKIPTRVYDLGHLSKGTHTFKIDVPDAEFVGGKGDIPLSAYLQGDQ